MISTGITIDIPSKDSMVGNVSISTEIEDSKSTIPGMAETKRINITNSDAIK